jgi:hypothetical protein
VSFIPKIMKKTVVAIKLQQSASIGTFRIVSVTATATQVGHTARATIFDAAMSGDAQIATVTPAIVRI